MGRQDAGREPGRDAHVGFALPCRAPPPPKASVRELMARALELESNRWTQDVAPQKLDARCHSELAIDIIQVAPAAPPTPAASLWSDIPAAEPRPPCSMPYPPLPLT